MNTVFAVLVLVIVGVIVVAAIIANTKVLNEQKGLRRELDDIQREADGIAPNPTDEQVAHLVARVERYRNRFHAFQHSPFVVNR